VTDGEAARAAILRAIKSALSGEPARELPAPAPVFPAQPADPVAMAESFRKELEALKGETIFVATPEAMPRALGLLLSQRGFNTAAVQNSTRVSAALAHVAGDRFFQAAGASSERIEAADCGIIEADALLADTGSIIAIFKNRGERLLPYLPRVCIAIADVSMLRPHMDDEALKHIYGAARDKSRGEGVIITGPSRSADIEKVLVLGAHGPAEVIVLIAGIQQA